MSFLRSSNNYVWSTTNVLGKGATGAVYQGVDRKTGETVAVKTFNHLSHMRPQDVQVREFEVLRKVKHENIVKLLAIEEENDQNVGKVIVMELCTGGSLFNILDDPENMYGLPGDEFMSVLQDLTAGMKHLRDKNLVHRDLKPGNIMKFIRDDGTIVYKLTDFGAARELQEDQKFVSLYGTEEYLHPDMYERAVLRKPAGKLFGAFVDLWSIGVTLYHVATGNLPFRPFGGRRNKEMMYHIITSKASGVISGVQLSENGPIDWCSQLPNNCRLNKGMKKIITPLLSGILEVDVDKMWSFDQFFAHVTKISKLKVFYVFNFANFETLDLFLDPKVTLLEFKSNIFTETLIEVDDQLLLLPCDSYQKAFNEWTDRNYPFSIEVTESKPFFLFSTTSNHINLKNLLDVEKPNFPNFLKHLHVENDAIQSKLACSVGYVYKRNIEKFVHITDLIYRSIDLLINHINCYIKELLTANQVLRDTTSLLEKIKDSNSLAQKLIEKAMDNIQLQLSSDDSKSTPFQSFKSTLESVIFPAVHTLNQRYLNESKLEKEWYSITANSHEKFLKQIGVKNRSQTYCNRLRESWQHLFRNRISKNLSFNEEQFHMLEKTRIIENNRLLKSLFDTESYNAISQLAEYFADWYKLVQTTFLQIVIMKKDMDQFQKQSESINVQLTFDLLLYQDKSKDIIENTRKIMLIDADSLTTNDDSGTNNNLSQENILWQEIATLYDEIREILCINELITNEIKNSLLDS